ncbi:MAG: VRR-NUC domain-containing protein [Alphaproteobacteria bacterium]|nr:VRR-NUC domain-containing protein [Alphaproteobacteria bacterium]
MARANPEDDIQKDIVEKLAILLPPEVIVTAVNPKGYRGKAAAGLAKALGQLAGIPDLTILLPDGRSVWIEVKAPEKYATPHQRALHERMRAIGHKVEVCRSIDDVVKTLEGWGVPMRGRLA